MGEVQPENFMSQAISLALKGKGLTAPNPPVGAVIVNSDGVNIGRGFHPVAGAPHAEVYAINDALNTKADLSNCTLYVTLEPCGHFGKTPPCVDLILSKNFKKVVVGSVDPNPLMQGKSLEKLKSGGVEVTSGVLKAECDKLIRGFEKVMTSARPFVVLKCAVSMDGKLATESGESKWITGPDARNYAHTLRAESDAILVGVNTVLADNPRLNARVENPSPNEPGKISRKVVLDSRLRTPLNAEIFKSPGDVIIYCDQNYSMEKKLALENKGATVVPSRSSANEGPAPDVNLDLNFILKDLSERGVQELLVEGGGKVLGSFLKNELFDEIKYFMAPKIIGEKGRQAFEGFNTETLGASPYIKNLKVKVLGSDFVFEGTR